MPEQATLDRFTTAHLGRHAGVTRRTAIRWATEWHGPTGRTGAHPLTHTDMLVARARQMVAPGPPLALAEAAIRVAPRRWLLAAGHHAETFDDPETAGRELLRRGLSCAQILDLAAPHVEVPGDGA